MTEPLPPALEAPVGPAQDATAAAFTAVEIPLEAIGPSPHNPRHLLADSDPGLVELAASIAQLGVVQPIVLRRPPPEERRLDGRTYELVAGERRWRAARIAGVAMIPAVVRDLTADQALEITITENLQRQDLSPLEEAAGVQALMARAGWTADAVADRLGRPLSWVVRRARLVTLIPAWRVAIVDDPEISQWTAAHLELVARLTADQQAAFLESFCEIYRNRAAADSVLSVAALRHEVADYTRELRHAAWPLDDAGLVPAAGSCVDCPKRSSCHPGLFDEEESIGANRVAQGDRCLDRGCWERKASAFVEARKMHLRAKHGGALVLVHGPEYSDQKPPKGETWIAHWQAPREAQGGKTPCLIVTGSQAGRLYWGASSPVTGRQAAAATPSAAEPGQPKTTLAERRKKLEQRRKAHALQSLVALLKDGKPRQPADHLVLALVAAFGTHGHAWGRFGGPYAALLHQGQSPAAVLDHLGSDPKEAMATLWLAVRPVLAENLAIPGGLDQVEDAWQYAKRFASAMTVNLPELLEQAKKAIPEPKSWATEAAAAKKVAKRGGGHRIGARRKEG